MEVHFQSTISQKAIIVRNKKILLERDNVWHLPGGRVNENEDLEEAFIRELQEEIGIKVIDPKLYRAIIFSNPVGRKKFALIYECDEFEGEPFAAQPEEVKELKWATLEEVKELPLIDEFKPVVIEYLTNLK